MCERIVGDPGWSSRTSRSNLAIGTRRPDPEGMIAPAITTWGDGWRNVPHLTMVSARLDPSLVAALKKVAERRGISLSDVVREAALLLLERDAATDMITFDVRITNERLGGVTSFKQDIRIFVLPVRMA